MRIGYQTFTYVAERVKILETSNLFRKKKELLKETDVG